MSGTGGKAGPTKGWTPALPEIASRPARIGEVLVDAHDSMIKRSGVALGHETWSAIVGDRIAARTRVASLSKGFLTIRVASSAWGTELSFLESDLLKRFAEVGLDVRKMRFQVDAEIGVRPSTRPGARAPRPSPTAHADFSGSRENMALPPELLARLATIEDPALRSSIAHAARSTLVPERSGGAPPTVAENEGRSGPGPRAARDK